MTTWKRRFSFL